MPTSFKPRPLKNLFTTNGCWAGLLEAGGVREVEVESVSQADMLRRVVQHIPEKHFRMIRYFGFLANRVCGQYLPKVYEALKMRKPGPTPKLHFA